MQLMHIDEVKNEFALRATPTQGDVLMNMHMNVRLLDNVQT